MQELEDGGGEQGLGVCERRGRGGDLEDGFEGEAELAGGEVVGEDLRWYLLAWRV